MKTDSIEIHAPGDESVGIFPATWKLKGTMEFDTEEDYQEFKKCIQEAFEFVSGEPVYLETQQEKEQRLAKENIYFCTICHENTVDADNGYDTCTICQSKK